MATVEQELSRYGTPNFQLLVKPSRPTKLPLTLQFPRDCVRLLVVNYHRIAGLWLQKNCNHTQLCLAKNATLLIGNAEVAPDV